MALRYHALNENWLQLNGTTELHVLGTHIGSSWIAGCYVCYKLYDVKQVLLHKRKQFNKSQYFPATIITERLCRLFSSVLAWMCMSIPLTITTLRRVCVPLRRRRFLQPDTRGYAQQRAR